MILDRFRLDGQVALVTGGTRGIGFGIAQAFAEAGARLIVSSRHERADSLEALRRIGKSVEYLKADLIQPEAPRRLIEEVLARHGRIDIVVNNAGIADHGDIEEISLERYRALMSTNLDSVFLMCQAALGSMRRQQSGVILNIGSISGYVSNIPQRQAAYNASKAAVHMLTKSLASDYAADNIRVNALAPGYIATDMTKGGFENPEWNAIWTSMTPMGRPGTIEETAAAALFLCAPASSYVTGAVLVIDGGYTLR